MSVLHRTNVSGIDGSERENKARHTIAACVEAVTKAEIMLKLETKRCSDAERKVVQAVESFRELKLLSEMKSKAFSGDNLTQARDVTIVLNEIFERRKLWNTTQKHASGSIDM